MHFLEIKSTSHLPGGSSVANVRSSIVVAPLKAHKAGAGPVPMAKGLCTMEWLPFC